MSAGGELPRTTWYRRLKEQEPQIADEMVSSSSVCGMFRDLLSALRRRLMVFFPPLVSHESLAPLWAAQCVLSHLP